MRRGDRTAVRYDRRRLTSPAVFMALLLATAASAHTTTSGAPRATDEREVWVSAQDASALRIMMHAGGVEALSLLPTQKPHLIEFSRSGKYAYVADVGAGDLIVVRARERRVVATLAFGSTKTHQARPSPDGSLLLVAQQAPVPALVKVVADEANEKWEVAGPPLPLPGVPDCTAFASDPRRAYVSLKPSGIAVIDVPTLTLVRTLPTEGEVACALVESRDRRTVFVAANGGGGHLYRLDTTRDTLTEARYEIRATDLHGLAVSGDERTAVVASRGSDELRVLDLRGTSVQTISVDATPNVADRPDMPLIKGSSVYVALRATGKVAIADLSGQRRVQYVDLVAPSASAVHGMAVAPDTAPPALSVAVPRQGLRSVRSTGLRTRVGCSESCDVSVQAVLVGQAPVAGRASTTLVARGERSLVVPLTSRAKSRLKGLSRAQLRVRFRAVDASGNAVTATRTVVLTR